MPRGAIVLQGNTIMGRKKILNFCLRPLGFEVQRLTNPHQKSDFYSVALSFKRQIIDEIVSKNGNVVSRGPFAGLRLVESGAWSDYDMLAKLIGSYECELFEVIERLIHRKPQIIINIGASEGYYAIGLKKRLPESAVYTYDIDINSFPALDRCQQLNGVTVSRLDAFSFSCPFQEIEMSDSSEALFLVDCEGCENGILEMAAVDLQRASFLIELHDMFVPGTSDRLISFLSKTHHIEIIAQKQRIHETYSEIQHLSDLLQSLILFEFRAERMNWLYAVPK